jgi:hypothetical protein
MKVTRRPPAPGETYFGRKGVLIPYRPPKEKPAPEPKGDRLIDPNDPLHDAIEDMLAGLSPEERVTRLNEMFRIKGITKWEK